MKKEVILNFKAYALLEFISNIGLQEGEDTLGIFWRSLEAVRCGIDDAVVGAQRVQISVFQKKYVVHVIIMTL